MHVRSYHIFLNKSDVKRQNTPRMPRAANVQKFDLWNSRDRGAV